MAAARRRPARGRPPRAGRARRHPVARASHPLAPDALDRARAHRRARAHEGVLPVRARALPRRALRGLGGAGARVDGEPAHGHAPASVRPLDYGRDRALRRALQGREARSGCVGRDQHAGAELPGADRRVVGDRAHAARQPRHRRDGAGGRARHRRHRDRSRRAEHPLRPLRLALDRARQAVRDRGLPGRGRESRARSSTSG